ncbi:hypothetical protein FA95DRAFT_624347 [Auriscalpium vulgare]|uniref:Uncharacterized protein n=1 Tax=Auriscalpium vulgare TaxID=40419 RepID=A0ACB8S1K9_9AGAM|nr:hypothetical protein FA95DRAFT_624347 [Auriscalpium vulgare]
MKCFRGHHRGHCAAHLWMGSSVAPYADRDRWGYQEVTSYLNEHKASQKGIRAPTNLPGGRHDRIE